MKSLDFTSGQQKYFPNGMHDSALLEATWLFEKATIRLTFETLEGAPCPKATIVFSGVRNAKLDFLIVGALTPARDEVSSLEVDETGCFIKIIGISGWEIGFGFDGACWEEQ